MTDETVSRAPAVHGADARVAYLDLLKPFCIIDDWSRSTGRGF